ncbi:MAG: hypothetical protein U1F77_12580 [Kiritimatiellia bacterium]
MLATVAIDKPDLALAHELVTKAMIGDPDSLFFLDAAARIAFLRGEKEEALKLIRLAVANPRRPRRRHRVRAIPARHYEKDEPPRHPHLRAMNAEMSNRQARGQLRPACGSSSTAPRLLGLEEVCRLYHLGLLRPGGDGSPRRSRPHGRS